MYYAVQYRSMHDARHYVLVFDDEEMANRYFRFIRDCEELPEYNYRDEGRDEIAVLEIDWRNPPKEYNNESLSYMNGDYIPDVYNA